jgi:hypothetical protein
MWILVKCSFLDDWCVILYCVLLPCAHFLQYQYGDVVQYNCMVLENWKYWSFKTETYQGFNSIHLMWRICCLLVCADGIALLDKNIIPPRKADRSSIRLFTEAVGRSPIELRDDGTCLHLNVFRSSSSLLWCWFTGVIILLYFFQHSY